MMDGNAAICIFVLGGLVAGLAYILLKQMERIDNLEDKLKERESPYDW